MQLLIVDDEFLVVDEIKNAINWERLGISQVHIAYNIIEARQQFEKNTLDILLCDIEMPEGNGLELLSWVRENHPDTEALFLTCHSDFSYARKASIWAVLNIS